MRRLSAGLFADLMKYLLRLARTSSTLVPQFSSSSEKCLKNAMIFFGSYPKSWMTSQSIISKVLLNFMRYHAIVYLFS